jgi:hypothetical protein
VKMLVLVDAVERKSGESCRVRIPLNIVKTATEQSGRYEMISGNILYQTTPADTV